MSATPQIKDEITHAVERATQEYFARCEDNIPNFVNRHFRYPGAITTNRVAFGWDMLRAPLNLFWAPIYALVCVLKYATGRSRKLAWFHRTLQLVPSGFSTRVQQHISTLVVCDLLQHHENNEQVKTLKHYIIDSLEKVYESGNKAHPTHQQFHEAVEPLVDEALTQYQVTRTASADIANSLSCTVLGAFAFKKFTPGGVGIAIVLASILTKTMATQNFIFGKTLGGIYYRLFPPEPSLATLSIALVAVMTVLSALAAFSGIVTDPIQAAMGLHQKRLKKMLAHLEQDFLNKTQNSFRPKDQFIARIMDTFDMIKSSLV